MRPDGPPLKLFAGAADVEPMDADDKYLDLLDEPTRERRLAYERRQEERRESPMARALREAAEELAPGWKSCYPAGQGIDHTTEEQT